MDSKGRNRWADLILWIVAIVLAATTVALYVNSNLFNSARFADHAQESLREPDVREVVSDRLGDFVVDELAEDAVAVRPLIDSVSGVVIESAAFQRLFRSAVLQTHRALIEGDSDSAVLTIANVGIIVSQGLRQLAPDIGNQIPESFDDALLQVASFKSVRGLSDAARASHNLSVYLVILTLLLLAAAFVISADRLRSIGRLGISLILGGGLIVAGYFIARFFALRPVVNGGVVDRHVGELIWDAFLSNLLTIAILMIGLGVVLSVVIDGVLSGVRVQDRARSFVDRVQSPESTRARVGWALGTVAFGLWLALAPLEAAGFVLTMGGVLVVAVGLQELALIAAPAPSAESGQAAAELRGQRKKYARAAAIGAIGAMITVTIVGAIHVGGGLQSFGLVRSTGACNGDEQLCDRPLNSVAIAATHNSMSVASSPNWLFPSQEESIASQLSDGIHGLLFDVYYAYPGRRVYTDTVRSSPKARSEMRAEFGDQFVDAADRIRRSISKPEGVDPELFMCHGFCELGATKLNEATSALRTYMEQNPREVVFVVIEDYVPWQDIAEYFERAGLRKYAYDGPWGPEWPTLGEMIDKNKRLMLMTEKETPTIPWMHNAYESVQETPFHFSNIEQLRAPSSCDEERGSPENTLFLINNWVDTAPNPRPSIARRVNSQAFLSSRIARCEKKRNLLASLIAVDFYREGDLFGVVDDLNASR
ncbi:MAG: hypothetical protein JHC98_07885 [Thermoleophilaceae bacterium]|nr:hypothetical protein [Thermoleophilaceae bacterium]